MNHDPTSPLRFDRGTILVRSSGGLEPALLPGVVWDHRVGAWRAPAHRLHDIQRVLAEADSTQKAAITLSSSQLGSPSGKWKPIDLRSYQQAALAAWATNGHRGIVVLPTGAGKTRLALAAAAMLQERTLILVPTRVLLGQWVAQIRDFYDGRIGVLGDGDHTIEDVTVSTFASGWRYMTEIGQRFETLILDEAHHFGDAVQDEALEMCTARWRLGLTATPSGDDGVTGRLSELVGPVVFQLSVADLAGTFLAPLESFCWLLPLTTSERLAYGRDMQAFHRFSLALRETILNPTWMDLVRIAAKSPEGRAAMTGYRRAHAMVSLTEGKTSALIQLLTRHAGSRILVFTADTTTAYRLSRFLLVPALTADIKRAERDAVIGEFRRAALPVLISCRVLNEGVDIPDAEIAIILGGANGDREHVQRVGRVLRPADGKVARVYELVAEDTFEVRQARRRNEALSG